MRELLELQSDLKDSKSFYDGLKGELVSNEVFVFTPKGDVIPLRFGATPLDFAYNIHSAIGNKCVGAKVNSKIVPLSYNLQSGEVVEILTNNLAKGPTIEWLKIAKTSGAKAKIRQFFKKEKRDDNIKYGRELLEREAKRRGYEISELMTDKALKPVLERYNIENIDEMYASVGYGAYTVNQILL